MAAVAQSAEMRTAVQQLAGELLPRASELGRGMAERLSSAIPEFAPAIDDPELRAELEASTAANVAQVNLRVADIQACYDEWRSKGAEFVTPPIDRGAEIRCYMRDPDGYMIEVGQATGLLEGRLAKKRPEDLPG